jgi:glutamyl-Q tRNA(Asp) synthetase
MADEIGMIHEKRVSLLAFVARLYGALDDKAMTAQAAADGQHTISTPVITRFAPSPTGRLHLGHAYSAMLSHDLARRTDGVFLLRIEDIDSGRVRPEFIDAIVDDLGWLGLTSDARMVRQSHRGALYTQALDHLNACGVIYRCVCTRAEIADSASAPHGDVPPPYPGTCRMNPVTHDDTRPSCWRIDMARAVAMAGIGSEALSWGDVVIARKDALASYHLAVVVDDAAQAVTDVVRGCDLASATPIHRVLQALLGLPVPRYHHHPLIAGPGGGRLAKRTPGATLGDLRASGVDPVVLLANLRSGRLPIGFAFTNP